MQAFKQIAAFGTVLTLFICTNVLAQSQNCELWLNTCPERLNGKTITVPLNVTAISANVGACDASEFIESAVVTGSGGTPAIMFVIDQSGSMKKQDPDGNRFRVTKALIDSVYKAHPDAYVGVTVFALGLVLDATRDSNLVLFGGTTDRPGTHTVIANQSYLPLRPLTATAKTGGSDPFYTGSDPAPKWYDVLSSLFVPPSGNQTAWTLNGLGNIDGTNISIGFESALETFTSNAFENAKIPKENQYIVFLSDGAADSDDKGCNERCGMQDKFIEGTNTPTTYTVFLVAEDEKGNNKNKGKVPASIIQMTENISKNGYSLSNPNSNYWPVSSDFDSLLTLMTGKILTPILNSIGSTPTQLVIKTTTTTPDTSIGYGVNGFAFTNPFALNMSSPTQITMDIIYNINIKETVDGKEVLRTNVDSTRQVTFNVEHSASVSSPQPTGLGLEVIHCKDDPTKDDPIKDDPIKDDPIKDDPIVDNPTTDNPTIDNPTTAAGESSLAAGPNPFTPGKSTLAELPPKVRDYYREIINAYGGEGKSGIFVAIESPKPIKDNSLEIVIYDAVGNVVLREKTKSNAKISGTNTYGFVWDGKNRRGRIVGPGTYLVRISGVQDNGQKVNFPAKKVGVKGDGKVISK